MIDKNRMYYRLDKMVKTPSISGTTDEDSATYVIEDLLYEIPYFQTHKKNVMRIPIKGDPFNRSIIAAYMELHPEKPETIILTGHYDVVDIEDYGPLQDIAFDIDEITKRVNELPLDEETQKDYDSGNWYFGRGTADMKIGHALCMELMQHYDEEGGINGNILYVAVCGEETNSEGMLAAVPFFNHFAEKHSLTYKVLLLTECFMVDKKDDETMYIQYGGSGKIMPMFFCVGKATHGEEPFLGLDANLLNAEIFKRLHMNTDFCESNHGITTAPPVGLKLQDLKQNYSLSSSLYSASYYNIATIKLQPEEAVQKLIKLAEDSFKAVNKEVEKQIQGFTEVSGAEPIAYRAEPCVRTFNEIYTAAERKYDGDLQEYIKSYATELMKENPEMQDACVKLIKRLYEMQDEKRPMIIISIIPPYYPDVNIDTEDAGTKNMLDCIDKLIAFADEKYGVKMTTSEYYGISDLCYTWLADGMDFDGIFNNLMGVNVFYNFPAEDIKKFKVPALVLGCYGKDLHKYSERLHKSYNFDVLPYLYLKYIDDILK